ncbi:MAG TPA: 3-isopropylmalate dehydratase small subunit [Kofleriaceae bacterium]|nr:3-isopropylmalate dehydratase small subunit [Kofleriaceae bacterium]
MSRIESRVVSIVRDDIDTDQIIPARYLRTTEKTGLADGLFAGWRYDGNGDVKPDSVLDSPANQGAKILLSGQNFGCGSSREHAAWALLDWGFVAVIARSFADIFRENAVKNGIVPVALDAGDHARLVAAANADGGLMVTVDVEADNVRLADGTTFAFALDPFAKQCLVSGTDALGYLMARKADIDRFERERES